MKRVVGSWDLWKSSRRGFGAQACSASRGHLLCELGDRLEQGWTTVRGIQNEGLGGSSSRQYTEWHLIICSGGRRAVSDSLQHTELHEVE